MYQILISQFNKIIPYIPKLIDLIIDKFLTPKQKELIKDSQPLTTEKDNLILVQVISKGINTYKGKHGELVHATYSKGIVHFKGHEIDFMSGYWGNGSAPKGEYIAKNYRNESGDAFSLFGIGFFIEIIPQFECDSTELGIHFDGGDGSDGKAGFLGTLGCIGLKAKSLDEATHIKNIFRDAFDTIKEIPLRII